jgi:hypothetical protein
MATPEVPTSPPADTADAPADASSDARRWLDAFDFERPATSAVGAWVRLIGWTIAILLFASTLKQTVRPLLVESTKTPMGPDEYEGFRYGMPLETREAIFEELAEAEAAERARAIENNTWKGHLWSREDDRGQQELKLARHLAKKYDVSLSQVYLVLDEAIREKWPTASGEPLLATTPPQDPRSTW